MVKLSFKYLFCAIFSAKKQFDSASCFENNNLTPFVFFTQGTDKCVSPVGHHILFCSYTIKTISLRQFNVYIFSCFSSSTGLFWTKWINFSWLIEKPIKFGQNLKAKRKKGNYVAHFLDNSFLFLLVLFFFLCLSLKK